MKWFLDTVNGSDTNTGLSALDAWQTRGKVEAAQADGLIGYGDVLEIVAGSVIYGPMFTSTFPVASRRTGQPFIVRAYGAGDKPVFDLYKYANEPEFWTEITTNVWEINLAPNNGTHTGNVAAPGNNIGHLLIDGEFFGYEKSSDSLMASQWDYYTERTGTLLRVYSVGNPADRTVSFGIAPPQNGMSARHDTIVEGLAFRGYGFHGFNTNLTTSKLQNFSVIGCDFEGGGGSHIPATGPRVGNGAQVWNGAENVRVIDCDFRNHWDVAMTCQGDVAQNQQGFINIEFRGNRSTFDGQGIELWYADNTGFGFRDVRFLDNDIVSPGWGWSYGPRPDKNKGVGILTYALRQVTDVEIAGNRFIGARDGYCYHNDASGSYNFPEGVRRHDNVVVGYLGTFVQYDESAVFGPEDGPEPTWAAWAAEHNTEQGTTFYTLTPGSDIGSKMTNTEAAAAVGAAREGKRRASREPGPANIRARYAAGRWYDFTPTSDTVNTYTGVNGQADGLVIEATSDGIMCGASVIIVTGAAGASVRFAVYEESITGQMVRVGNFGAASASTPGECKVVLANGGVKIRPGFRYLVEPAVIGTGVVLQAATQIHEPMISANSATAALGQKFNGYRVTGITGDNFPLTLDPPLTGTSTRPAVAVLFK